MNREPDNVSGYFYVSMNGVTMRQRPFYPRD